MSIILFKYFVHIFDLIKKKIVWATTFLVLKKIQRDANFWMSPLKMCISPGSSNDSKETHSLTTFSSEKETRSDTQLQPQTNFCSVTKTRSVPRLVLQSLQNLTTCNWISFLFWKRSVCTSAGWWLQELCWPAEAMGVLSALMRSWRVTEATTKVN